MQCKCCERQCGKRIVLGPWQYEQGKSYVTGRVAEKGVKKVDNASVAAAEQA